MTANGIPAKPSAVVTRGPSKRLARIFTILVVMNIVTALGALAMGQLTLMLLNGRHDVDAIFAGLNNARLRELAAKISSDGDDAFGPLDAAIEITFQNGERIAERVDCRKELRFYPTMADMPQRLRALCSKHLSASAIDDLVSAVDALQYSGGADRLLDLLGTLGEPPGNG